MAFGNTLPDSRHALLILGASGHSKVVMDSLRCLHGHNCLLQLADDNLSLSGILVMGISVVSPIAKAIAAGRSFHVAIGNNQIRSRLAQACIHAGMQYSTVVHPRAMVASSATFGRGVFVAAGAVVGPEANLGNGCIVNHGAVVDHDCKIGAYCHIAPNATLGGGVQLGAHVMIGAGANILPGVAIGEGCVVGAGAVVVHDLTVAATYAGVPAQIISGQSNESGSN